MNNKLKALAQARANYEAVKADKERRLKLFWESEENAELLYDEAATKSALEDCESQVRGDALALFEVDNEKKHDGYQIKTITSVSITDSKAAFEWCLSNFTPALQLNNKVFKSAAKDGNIPGELTEVKEEPKVYVDKDLSRFLEE